MVFLCAQYIDGLKIQMVFRNLTSIWECGLILNLLFI